jgi:hypothetical protein
MSRGQRLGFLAIAAVIAIVAVVILGSSGGDDEQDTTAATTPTAAQSPAEQQEASPVEADTTPEPTPTPRPKPPLLTADNPGELEFKEGDTIRFRVRSATADHVHVHGYDLMRDVPAGGTITMSFKATITGIFEIELEDSGRQLGSLKVEP